MALTGRPKVSAATMAIMVRVAVPRSWVASSTSTEASGWMVGAAGAGVARAAPGVDAESQAALDGTAARIAAQMPVLLPLDQLGAFLELTLVDFGARGVVDVLQEELERIHLQLRGHIFQRRASDKADLRMVGSAPGARAAGIDRNRGVIDRAVGDVAEHIREQLRVQAAAAESAGGPGLGFPGGDGAVFLGADFDLARTPKAGCRRWSVPSRDRGTASRDCRRCLSKAGRASTPHRSAGNLLPNPPPM